MTTTPKTAGQKVNADITALLKARNSLLWITTREELRVERALISACGDATFPTFFWDCADGITSATGDKIEDARDPSAALGYIRAQQNRAVFVMRDLHRWLGDPMVLRALRNLAKELQEAAPDVTRAIIILTPSTEVPAELSGHATCVEYPIPDRAEIGVILDTVLESLGDAARAKIAPTNGSREAAIDSAVGLTAEEATSCYARSLVTAKKIDPAIVSSEKRRVIAREKVLTWHEPDPRGLEGIGGLDGLKAWLKARRAAFSPRAKAFGLPSPKGMMLVGVPGCGKSLTAKCIASAWGVPLLRLDLGAMRSKYVGESEQNLRKALAVAEAVSPCVLWLDEVEKALAGSTGEQGDGGVSADALGAILNWMQERQGSVFVVATSNDVSKLPPELLRKGRFDELFFVDLPQASERRAIMTSALAQTGRTTEGLDLDAIERATVNFTGSEIANLVPEALFVAFGEDERAIRTEDLVEAAKNVVPLAKTMADKIGALKEWASTRARAASTPETSAKPRARQIDLT